MWNNPRPVRTEIVSIDTDRLAKHAFAQTGLVCIQAAPVASGTQLTVCPVAHWSPKPGVEYWLRQPKDATKVLDELVSIDELVSSRTEDGSVMVEAGLDQVDAAIMNCVEWRRVKLVTKAEIDARIESVRSEIDRALLRLQVTGSMSVLNQQYKQLRARPRAEGEKAVPAYKAWATKQLEAQILRLIPLTV